MTAPEPNSRALPNPLASRILAYLKSCPWEEVNDLVGGLIQCPEVTVNYPRLQPSAETPDIAGDVEAAVKEAIDG